MFCCNCLLLSNLESIQVSSRFGRMPQDAVTLNLWVLWVILYWNWNIRPRIPVLNDFVEINSMFFRILQPRNLWKFQLRKTRRTRKAIRISFLSYLINLSRNNKRENKKGQEKGQNLSYFAHSPNFSIFLSCDVKHFSYL